MNDNSHHRRKLLAENYVEIIKTSEKSELSVSSSFLRMQVYQELRELSLLR
jgi:hypothetical protein